MTATRTLIRTVLVLGAVFATTVVGPGHAESLPARGAIDSRIRTATFSPEEIYRLYGFVGYAIELIFEEGEQFAGNAGGDLDAITFAWHDNHMILKPKVASVGTNLVVYTNRRAYRFEYSAFARRPDTHNDPVMFAVRFIYPPEYATPVPTDPTVPIEQDLAAGTTGRPQNADYWFCGSRAIKPVAAFDDGVHTRLTFAAKGELPAVFVRNDDGTESLLNFSMEAGDVVIHRVAARLVLRRGQLTGCVINKGFAGGGERLQSGTVSPRVQRDRKESTP
ncbi:MAG: TrbG/VirB9 family P-type conjugative transfer protein [Steroidobacteraceae bacterium]